MTSIHTALFLGLEANQYYDSKENNVIGTLRFPKVAGFTICISDYGLIFSQYGNIFVY